MAQHLSIDIETYSSVDLRTGGLYKYVQSPDFQILLLACALDGGQVTGIDLTDPSSTYRASAVKDLLLDPDIIKHAYNAPFEWYCLSKWLGMNAQQANDWLPQWRCTMLHGLYCGYTAGLAATGKALGLAEDKQKLRTGSALIRTFCVPCKPTKANGGRTRTLPHHEPEKWALFKRYNAQDVITEMAIESKLSAWPVPNDVQRQWELDQIINARGVQVDRQLIDGALYCSEVTARRLTQEAVSISGLANPNSVAQLTQWLQDETGQEVDNLRKDTVRTLLAQGVHSDAATRMLGIRQELGKTSIKKYQAMEAAAGDGDRIRGLLQFYGANRTGRWAGRLVQVQNLPRNYLDTLDTARSITVEHKPELLQWVYGNVPDTLSQLIRTALVPSPGNRFIVADFSAIEARVIAWLASETWRQEVFATHGKIYEASASAMFGVPIDRIAKGNPEYALRQKGKIAELALGYGGGVNALITMGALSMGLTEDELPGIVQKWRTANPRICELWRKLERAAMQSVRTGEQSGAAGILFTLEADYRSGLSALTMQLPSGRKLFYPQPCILRNKFDRDALHYMGLMQGTKKWCRLSTYGGKLVENAVQAIARDCLAIAIGRLEEAGYPVVMHIHDEVVIDMPKGSGSLESACGIMAEPIDWAPGLLLRADGFEGDYYRKE